MRGNLGFCSPKNCGMSEASSGPLSTGARKWEARAERLGFARPGIMTFLTPFCGFTRLFTKASVIKAATLIPTCPILQLKPFFLFPRLFSVSRS